MFLGSTRSRLDRAFGDVTKIEDLRGRVVILDFWAKLDEPRTPEARSDARRASWVPIDQVGALETTEGVVAAVECALDLARGPAPDRPLFAG